MGRNVDLHKYNYDKLVNCLMDVKGIDNKEILESILLTFGEKIGETYILLNNEFIDNYNCYYNIANFIDGVFGCEDSFDQFCCNEKADCVEMISAVDIYEAEESLKKILIGKYKYTNPDDK